MWRMGSADAVGCIPEMHLYFAYKRGDAALTLLSEEFEALHTIQCSQPIYSAGAVPQGQHILVGGQTHVLMIGIRRGKHLEERTQCSLAVEPDPTHGCQKLLVSTDRSSHRRVFVASGPSISVHALSGQQVRGRPRAHNRVITAVSFRVTDGRVFSGSRDGVIKSWTPHLELLCVFAGHTAAVLDVRALFHGEHAADLVVSIAEDKTLRLWDTVSREALYVLSLDYVFHSIITPLVQPSTFILVAQEGMQVFRTNFLHRLFALCNTQLAHLQSTQRKPHQAIVSAEVPPHHAPVLISTASQRVLVRLNREQPSLHARALSHLNDLQLLQPEPHQQDQQQQQQQQQQQAQQQQQEHQNQHSDYQHHAGATSSLLHSATAHMSTGGSSDPAQNHNHTTRLLSTLLSNPFPFLPATPTSTQQKPAAAVDHTLYLRGLDCFLLANADATLAVVDCRVPQNVLAKYAIPSQRRCTSLRVLPCKGHAPPVFGAANHDDHGHGVSPAASATAQRGQARSVLTSAREQRPAWQGLPQYVTRRLHDMYPHDGHVYLLVLVADDSGALFCLDVASGHIVLLDDRTHSKKVSHSLHHCAALCGCMCLFVRLCCVVVCNGRLWFSETKEAQGLDVELIRGCCFAFSHSLSTPALPPPPVFLFQWLCDSRWHTDQPY